MLRKLAVTGSLAAGKSTACRWLQQRGAFCVSADAIVSRFLDLHHPIAHQIIDLLGSDIAQVDSVELNRRLVAERLFSNPDQLALVQQWMHPEVWRLIQQAYQEAPSDALLFVAEVPLLYEVGWQSWFDAVLFVDAPAELRLQRFISRGGATKADFEARQAHLLDNEEKKQVADYVLDTTLDENEMAKELHLILQQFFSTN